MATARPLGGDAAAAGGGGGGGLAATPRLCLVCKRQASKYTCPQCNVPYCSVACFKAHGEQCTEKFYQRSVLQELHVRGQSDEDKRKMVQILRRQAGLADDDDDDDNDNNNGGGRGGGGGGGRRGGDIGEDDDEMDAPGPDGGFEEAGGDEAGAALVTERLQELALKADDLSLDDLTEAERRQFLRAALGGQLSAQIAVWQPWWSSPAAAAAASLSSSSAASSSSPLLMSPGSSAAPSPAITTASASAVAVDGGGPPEADTTADETLVPPGAPAGAAADKAAATTTAAAEVAAAEGEAVATAAAAAAAAAVVAARVPISRFPMRITPMAQLCPLRRTFPPQLRYNLVDLLCAFACTLRLYNGDLDAPADGDPLGAALALAAHSGTLSDDARYATCEEAVTAFAARLRGTTAGGGDGGGNDGASVAATAAAATAAAQHLVTLQDVGLLLADGARVARATRELCFYLHRAYRLADLWWQEARRGSTRKKQKKNKTKQQPHAAAPATRATTKPHQAKSPVVSCTSSAGAAVDDGEEAAVAAHVSAWSRHLGGASPADGGGVSAAGAGRRPAPDLLKRQRKALSGLRRKAHFYASWTVDLLAPGQLRALRAALHEQLDAAQAAARRRGQLLEGARREQEGAVPALLLGGGERAAGRRRVAPPKNFAIHPTGPVVER